MAPGSAMKNPKTAEVPIAWCIFLEKTLKVGTLKLPPPIPIKADKKPIEPLIKKLFKNETGISFPIVVIFFWKNIFNEIKNDNIIKINTKISPWTLLAKNDPIKDPVIIPKNHLLTTLMSIFFNFRCDLIEEIEVNKIIVKEDATEMCITLSVEYPNASALLIKTKYEIGTIIMPPPTPNKPASKPERSPVNKNVMIKIANQNTFLLYDLCSKQVK